MSEKDLQKRNMEFYNKGYEVGYKHGTKRSIIKFTKTGDIIVQQIKLRYGKTAKGSEYLEKLFKDEIKKLEEKLN